MTYFGFGVLSIIVSFSFAAAYDRFRFISTGESFQQRVLKPKRAYLIWLFLFALIGFIFGCLLQAKVDFYRPCMSTGNSFLECIANDKNNNNNNDKNKNN